MSTPAADIGRRLEDADTPAERLAAIAQALDELPPLRLADMVALRRHGYTLMNKPRNVLRDELRKHYT